MNPVLLAVFDIVSFYLISVFFFQVIKTRVVRISIIPNYVFLVIVTYLFAYLYQSTHISFLLFVNYLLAFNGLLNSQLTLDYSGRNNDLGFISCLTINQHIVPI